MCVCVCVCVSVCVCVCVCSQLCLHTLKDGPVEMLAVDILNGVALKPNVNSARKKERKEGVKSREEEGVRE